MRKMTDWAVVTSALMAGLSFGVGALYATIEPSKWIFSVVAILAGIFWALGAGIQARTAYIRGRADGSQRAYELNERFRKQFLR